jgi:hypothetical protein
MVRWARRADLYSSTAAITPVIKIVEISTCKLEEISQDNQ